MHAAESLGIGLAETRPNVDRADALRGPVAVEGAVDLAEAQNVGSRDTAPVGDLLLVGIALRHLPVGRASALLRRMQDKGLVDVAGPLQSGQIRQYRVLPAMTRAFSGRLTVDLKSLAAHNGKAASALEAIEADDRRAVPLLAVLAELVVQSRRTESATPAGLLNGASSMAKGHAMALSIGFDAMDEHGEAGEGWIRFGLTSYAQRFDVSRAHVHRLLQKLKACGLVHAAASPSTLLVTGRFIDELKACQAAEYRLLSDALESLAV